MSNFDPHRYTITIKLVTLEEGEYFEALVGELPDLVEYGETYDQAYSLAVDSITTLNEAALEQGRVFPEPMPSQALEEFSGRVTLRMSKSLHARVSKLADREGVSLNSWIVEAISARASAGFSAWAVEHASRAETYRAFNAVFQKSERFSGWVVGTISTHASTSTSALAIAYVRGVESSRAANVIPEQTLGESIRNTTWSPLKPVPFAGNPVITLMGGSTQICTAETSNPMLTTIQ
jgi:predicted HicB family RNase H-like nuclease